jgi:hypothetical protein
MLFSSLNLAQQSLGEHHDARLVRFPHFARDFYPSYSNTVRSHGLFVDVALRQPVPGQGKHHISTMANFGGVFGERVWWLQAGLWYDSCSTLEPCRAQLTEGISPNSIEGRIMILRLRTHAHQNDWMQTQELLQNVYAKGLFLVFFDASDRSLRLFEVRKPPAQWRQR